MRGLSGRPVKMNLPWIVCVVVAKLLVIVAVASSFSAVQVQQQQQQQLRPDAVRHELSRLNRAARFQLATPVSAGGGGGGLLRSLRMPNGLASNRGIFHSTSLFLSGGGGPSVDTPHRAGRPARFVSQPRVLRLAVLAPSDPEHQFSLLKILPAITLAARTIERSSKDANGGPLPGWRIQIVDRDSKCSSIYGPLEAIDLYNSKAIGKYMQ